MLVRLAVLFTCATSFSWGQFTSSIEGAVTDRPARSSPAPP